MTTTTTQHKTALKIEIGRAAPGMPVLVSIYKNDGPWGRSDYWADILPSGFGTAIRFRKIWDGRDFVAAGDEDEVRDVLIEGDNHTCECMGFLRHGHCRHIDAALAILEAGLVKPAPRPEHAEEVPVKAEKTETELLWSRLERVDPSTARILRRARCLCDGELARAVASAERRVNQAVELDDL